MKTKSFIIGIVLLWASCLWAFPPVMPGSGTILPSTCSNGQVITYNTTSGAWDTCAGLAGGGDLLAAQNLADLANAATARTNLGLAIGTNVQAYDADLTTYAGITPSANIQTLLGSADFSAARTNLGLAIGTNVQAYDADLTTYAGITPSANVQSLLGAADYAAIKGLLSIDDLVTLSGVADGAVNLGAFTGSTITDNLTIKAAMQALETAFEGLPGGHTQNTDTGTDSTTFMLGTGGIKLKTNTGVLEVRNNADSAYDDLKALTIEGTTITATVGFSGAHNGTVGATTPAAGAFTTLNASGTTTLATALTGVLRADSGVVSVDADVTDLVGAASTSAAGKIEIATNAETTTGTSTSLAVTPDDLAYLFARPFAIGATTPAAGTFTNLSASGTTTLATALTGVLRADSGVVSVDSDVTDLVGAASTSAAGKIEIATNAETTTGTSTSLAVTPDDLAYLFARPFAIGATTPAAGTFTTISGGAAGFTVDADGDVTAKSLTITRVAGQASYSDFYEVPANGNNKVTLKAADSLAADYTVTLPSSTGTLIGTGSSYSTVVGLWTTCTGYLKSDGTCDSPVGSGDVTGGTASGAGELAAYTDTTGKAITRSYVSFTGPSTSVKAKTISNAADTIAELGQANTFTGLNSFNALLAVGNGATGPGAIRFKEDSDNGTNYMTLIGQSSLADDTVVITLPSVTSTLATLGANTFTGTQALGANDLTMTGSLAATGARVTKGWFTDIESTNMPTVGGTSLYSTFAPLASPVFTGVVDIPENATTDAEGEITIDTTTDQLRFYGAAQKVIPSVQYFSFVIPAPADTDDINVLKAPFGMTITGVSCIVQGTTSVTGQIQECDSAGANCADTDSDITCDADGAADDGSFTNASIDSADWIRWKTTSVSGTPTFLTVTVKYTVVAD